jgi:FRG domain-containing protein
VATDWAEQVGQTLEPGPWAECLHHLMSSGTENALYRGHRRFDWELRSLLERALEENLKQQDPDKALLLKSMVDDPELAKWTRDMEVALTQRFRYQATRFGIPDLPPAWDTLGWWEVMQHHRAPTRLMDWSASPVVALWFAVDHHKDGDGDMALWVYDRRTARANLGKLKARLKETNDYEQLDDRQLQNQLFKLALEDPTDLLIPVAPRQFPRSVAQQSVLTVSANITAALPGARWIRGKLATRVRLREAWKPAIQAVCRSMGLSRLSLFRDLDSLGDSIKEIFINSRDVPDPY